jgi:hypothetical protein
MDSATKNLSGALRHCATFVGSDMWSLIIENLLCCCKFVLANMCPELGHAWTNQGNISPTTPLAGGIHSLKSIPGLHKRLKIRAPSPNL